MFLNWCRTLFFLFLLFGCGGSNGEGKEKSYGENALEAYQAAYEELNDEDFEEAEKAFRSVSREYPFSRLAALAELRIGDCLFAQDKFSEAVQAYRQFIRRRPSHKLIYYARFKIAESYYEQIPEDWFLVPAPYERDQTPAREALRHVGRFLDDYPESEYSSRARSLFRKVYELLAAHEMYVAEYYLDEDAFEGAVMRLQTLLSRFGDSHLAPKAYRMLIDLYLQLGQEENAKQAAHMLVTRFPKSRLSESAKKILTEQRKK